ncbi:MAG: hypothetical protein KHY27_11190, partial [Butyricicoccus pullicaecorum]|nr:hypothetical protein [Butyricicoccus pullicaecorum]
HHHADEEHSEGCAEVSPAGRKITAQNSPKDFCQILKEKCKIPLTECGLSDNITEAASNRANEVCPNVIPPARA